MLFAQRNLIRKSVIEQLEQRSMLAADMAFSDPEVFRAGHKPWAITTGDYNGDDIQDLAVANFDSLGDPPQPWGDVSIFMGLGTGNLSREIRYKANGSPDAIYSDDVDGDGDVDVLVSNVSSSDISVLLNQGDGTFPDRSPTYFVGKHPAGLVSVDINGDGVQDIVVVSQNPGSAHVLLGEGDGKFSAPDQISSGERSQTITVADFDRNGKMDIAYDNRSANSISVVLQSEDSSFQDRVSYPTKGRFSTGIFAADLDGDGNVDLATANSEGPDISIFNGNADGTFDEAAKYAAGSGPNRVVAADFDADGDLDLVVSNPGASQINILENDGGVFLDPQRIRLRAGWSFDLTIADFNGDRMPDLAITTDRGVAILLNETEVEETPNADFNSDQQLNAADIDILAAAIRADAADPKLDLDGSGDINQDDYAFMVERIVKTFPGDIDLNGRVEFADFLQLSGNFGQAGGWSDGDANGDAQIDFADFLLLAENFGSDREMDV